MSSSWAVGDEGKELVVIEGTRGLSIGVGGVMV